MSQMHNFWQNMDKMEQNAETNFPEEFAKNNNNKNDEKTIATKPTKLTFEKLEDAAKVAHCKFVNNEWDKGTAQAHPKRHCFNSEAIKQTTKCAEHCLKKK